LEWFSSLSGATLALIATGFTYAFTALGASLVFFVKNVGKTAFCIMLSAAAGVMLASSFFSLLLPALEGGGDTACLALFFGFLLGGGLIIAADALINKGKRGGDMPRSSAVMCMAITVHNIPEGLAVGIAFGALSGGANAASALILALGVGLQNFPEGLCVALPLRAYGKSRIKSFFMGQLSGAVEVVFGVLGALAASYFYFALPFALSFSAGAMIAVVCSELIPEAFAADKVKAIFFAVLGFAVMMALDLALG